MRRVSLSVKKDDEGTYAWIETRFPGGRRLNRLAAVRALRRQYPEAYDLQTVEQWHIPLSHHAFKVRFQW